MLLLFKMCKNSILMACSLLSKFTSMLENCLSPNTFKITQNKNLLEVNIKNVNYVIHIENEIIDEFNIRSIPYIHDFKTNFFFGYILLHSNGNTYNIELQTPYYTYYITGNILDAVFFANYLNLDLSTIGDYKLEILDNNMQVKHCSNIQKIVFEKDSYKII